MSGLSQTPIIGFCAASGTGKTTLLSAVVSNLTDRGLRVAVIKQARADFDVDQAGKDSHELRKAGVAQTLIASDRQSALMVEHPGGPDPDLAELIGRLDLDDLDVVLYEGFSQQHFDKIELRRIDSPGANSVVCYSNVIAVACDDEILARPDIPALPLTDPSAVAEFVQARVEQVSNTEEALWT